MQNKRYIPKTIEELYGKLEPPSLLPEFQACQTASKESSLEYYRLFKKSSKVAKILCGVSRFILLLYWMLLILRGEIMSMPWERLTLGLGVFAAFIILFCSGAFFDYYQKRALLKGNLSKKVHFTFIFTKMSWYFMEILL